MNTGDIWEDKHFTTGDLLPSQLNMQGRGCRCTSVQREQEPKQDAKSTLWKSPCFSVNTSKISTLCVSEHPKKSEWKAASRPTEMQIKQKPLSVLTLAQLAQYQKTLPENLLLRSHVVSPADVLLGGKSPQ